MEYVAHHPRRSDRSRTPQPTFSLRFFAAALGFLAFALVYVTLGLRWHTNRAQASLYAQQEIESTFKAAEYKRAALNPGHSDDSPRRAVEYRRLAEMHAKAADECRRLKELHEQAW